MSNAPPKQFFTVFPENTAFFEKLVEYLICDKKGYIHFWCKMTPDKSHSVAVATLQTKYGLKGVNRDVYTSTRCVTCVDG